MSSILVTEAAFSTASSNIVSLLSGVIAPLLSVVMALGAIYCIILGVKFAKAEEPQDREKAKSALKNAIIGFVLIFVLIMLLYTVGPALQSWMTTFMQ